MSPSADNEERFVRNPDLHVVDMDGELVMMGLEQGEYYGMREVSATIWSLLDIPRTVPEICDEVARQYEVSAEQCKIDVTAFLQQLTAKNLAGPLKTP